MSLTTYSELQTAIASWIARDDLTSTLPDFVTLFEADVNRKLRVRQMEVTQTTTPSTAGQFSLPTDYLAWKKVTYRGSSYRELEYAHPSMFAEWYASNPAGTPNLFTIAGTTDAVGVVKVTPASTTAVDFTYYQKVTALSTSNTSNWLLAAHPDVYLAGSLVEAYAFTKDYDQAAVWKARRDDLIEQIQRLDQKTRGPSAIRTDGVNP